MAQENVKVLSPNVHYNDDYIEVDYQYTTSFAQRQSDNIYVSLAFFFISVVNK